MTSKNALMSRTATTAKPWQSDSHPGYPVSDPNPPMPTLDNRRAHQLKSQRRALWFAAIKPPMYTVAITPMLVGSMAAYAETGVVSLSVLLTLLQAAIAVIAWLNLSNDVYDYDRRIDENKPESVVNLCGATNTARNFILVAANLSLAIAFRAFKSVAEAGEQWDGTIIVLMIMAVTAGYAYQAPPFRLGYLGLGEPITLFGWTLGVCVAYYAQIVHHVPTSVMLAANYPTVYQRVVYILGWRLWARHHYLGGASVLVAVPTALILFCSHFHQHDDDKKAGKKSPIVRLGVKRAVAVLEGLLVGFLMLEWLLYGVGMVPMYPFYASFLALPYALSLADFVRENYGVPNALKPAKYYAVKFHFVHGICVGGGFLLTALRKSGQI